MGKLIDLTGQKLSRLYVIFRDTNYILNGKIKEPRWKCLCDCGNYVTVLSGSLKSGKTQSCGCLHSERQKQFAVKHGSCCNRQNDRLYRIWNNMKQRCNNPNRCYYDNYGGRGITICEEWQNSFEEFRNWAIKNGYENTLTIDRIDPNGNYCPSNCRWTTHKVQANNKLNNHLITVNGETKTLSEWSDSSGVPVNTIRSRIVIYGWTPEEAILTPVRHRR